MPKNLVPAKKRPAQTSRPARSGSVGAGCKKAKPKPKNAGASSVSKVLGSKSKIKKIIPSAGAKLKVKKPAVKKEAREKLKKVVEKKEKQPRKTGLEKPKKKSATPGKKIEKANAKRDGVAVKEPVEVVISVKKPKLKSSAKNDPKPCCVSSGKVSKKSVLKTGQMRKDLLKKLSGKMDEKLESVVNTILEVAVVKKVHPPKKTAEELAKDKKKTKDVRKKCKESKDVKSEQKKTDIKAEIIDGGEKAEVGKEMVTAGYVQDQKTDDKSNAKFKVKGLNDDDVRKMEIKKEIIDEFLEEEEKQSKAKLEKKKITFLKKPKTKAIKEANKKEIDEQNNPKTDSEGDKNRKIDSSKSNASKSDHLVKRKSKTKKKKPSSSMSDSDEKPADSGGDLNDLDEETKAKRMKLYGFWAGPKRHRVASLNAIAKVHCLYENESRGAMAEMFDKSIAKVSKKRVGQRGRGDIDSDTDDKKQPDNSAPVPPKRSLRTAPGSRSVGLHYDVETSSSSPCSSSSSDAETEDEKSTKRENPLPQSKSSVEKNKGKGKAKEKKVCVKKEKIVEEAPKDDPSKKVRKRRRRCELMMDLKDMVVRKRMASLNASAMLAATYSVEKKTTVKSDDDKRKRASQCNTTTTDTQSSSDVEPDSSDDEVILSGSSKKVAVIVNQDTDVTITGLYLNSTTRSTRHCSITGMQYRISSTSHTQTEGAAVSTETVIHTTDHVSVSHSSNSSSVEAVGSPGGSCKSYTPLGALSSMQPPGNSSPLMRRHPCSSSAFSAPPPYHHHHHQDMHGYYQPAGPLISHHYHAGASSSSTLLPAVNAPPPPSLSKGSPGPPSEQTSTSRPPGEPPSEPPPQPPPQEYRPPPPPFATSSYPPPPPHHTYYPYLQPPYQECYNPYLKYSPHPGFRRPFWPGHSGSPTGGPSGGPMVSGGPDAYHGSHGAPPGGGGGPIESYPLPHHHHQVPQGPPQPAAYYYAHSAPPPPTCYSHPAPLRAPLFMPESSYQACPCPSMSTFPKNVLTGPLTGASKGSVQTQAQNSAAQMCGDQQVQSQLQSAQAAHGVAQGGPTAAQPNVALALTLETNNPLRGPPSPARGSAGLPTPASPALSTAQQPTSWSPPTVPPETKPSSKQEPCDEIKRSTERSPPPLTLVSDEPPPPVLENQLQAAQRRPRPPKRKPSIERQVSPVPDENLEPPVLEDTKPIILAEPENVAFIRPKRRRSVTPLRSKSEPVKVGTRGQTKKPAETSDNAEKNSKPLETKFEETPAVSKIFCNGHSKAPKIMDSQRKTNGVVEKPAAKNAVQKMLLKNSAPNAQTAVTAPVKLAVPSKVAVKSLATLKGKKESCKTKGVKTELKKVCKKLSKKPTLALPHPVRGHLKGLKWSNGWSWEGDGFKARVFLAGDESPVYRKCYQAMRHIEGDIIFPMDCILLKSGPRKQQLPFIAKVASLWENPDDGEMMISLLWYYRPEHTDQGRQPLQPDDEVFASRHRDTNSVACIEDKCYVLTFNEYCRYKKSLSAADCGVALDRNRMVPLADSYPRSRRLPPGRIAKELLFFCRKVYDFRTKRLQKNPAKC